MDHGRWLLYGAYGYTGQLIIEEALRRGHRPTLSGRSAEKLEPLGRRYALPIAPVSLEDTAALRKVVEEHRLVLHAAGPFIHTAEPMRRACLSVGAHYLDITGEIPVFEDSFAADREARERGVVVMSGVGFDVVPTDCLARYVAEKVKDPKTLDIGISALGSTSAGTMKSSVESLARGGRVRRDGMLIPWPIGKGARRLRFTYAERSAVPIPWGDLVTAFHTTGIPNITTYMTFPKRQVQVMSLAGRAFPLLLRPAPVRRLVNALIDRKVEGPDEQTRRRSRSYVYARAESANGEAAEAWLETIEGYHLTAITSVLAVERTLGSELRGALTPARAFGADFVLEVPDTKRFDSLP